MGREKSAKYNKSIYQQAHERFYKMQAFGESKNEAKKNGTDKDKIFSRNTMVSYLKHTKYFARYVQERHPECTTLGKARQYVNEWLQSRVEQGLSSWTVQMEAKALGKLYGISPNDRDYFEPPARHRVDIVRSRGERERDRHFSEAKNENLVKFCCSTGLRRSELAALRGGDLISREQIEVAISHIEAIREGSRTPKQSKQLEMLRDTRLFREDRFIYVRNGKGGKERLSPIIGQDAEKVVARMQDTPKGKPVWQHIHSCADIHSYRAEYATAIYKSYSREIEDIPYDRINKGSGRKYQSEVYACRKDEAGRKMDKAAMLACSKALGHNRISVVAEHYIRDL